MSVTRWEVTIVDSVSTPFFGLAVHLRSSSFMFQAFCIRNLLHSED